MLISHIRNIFTHCDCYTCTNITSWDEFMYLTFKEKLFTVLLCFYRFKKHMKTKKWTLASLEKKYTEFKNSCFKRFSEYSLNYMLCSHMTRTTITPFSNITEQRGKDVNSSLNSLLGIFWCWSFPWSHTSCMGTVYTDRFISNEDIPRNIIQKHWTGMTDVIKSVSQNPETS